MMSERDSECNAGTASMEKRISDWRTMRPGMLPARFKGLILRLREVNAELRALPNFMIIGAQKAGSTSLFNYLALHPQVLAAMPKEIFYFNEFYTKGERWYRRHFPTRRALAKGNAITGEASTMYLCSPDAPGRVAQDLPNVKVLVVLREPATRAVSHYFHRRRTGREMRAIREVFSDGNIRRWCAGESLKPQDALYFNRSYYARDLKNWLKHIPADRISVVQAERLFQNPTRELERVYQFLGIEKDVPPPPQRAFNAGGYHREDPPFFADLREAFRAYNEELAALSIVDFAWEQA